MIRRGALDRTLNKILSHSLQSNSIVKKTVE